MTTDKIRKLHGLVAGVAVLGVMLLGCGREPAPAPAEPASAPPADEAPAATPAPGETPPAPSPAPTPPPPTDPSAAPRPTAAIEPALESMQRATPSAKISVPVDLRYQFDATHSGSGTLHVAAVPRVAGTGLRVSIKQTPGIALQGGALEVQKASAGGIYRQQFSVSRSGTAPDQLRVLVTMDMPEGKAFGYFSIPLGTLSLDAKAPAKESPAQLKESVKQR